MKVEISRYLENKNSFREKVYAERSISWRNLYGGI